MFLWNPSQSTISVEVVLGTRAVTARQLAAGESAAINTISQGPYRVSCSGFCIASARITSGHFVPPVACAQ